MNRTPFFLLLFSTFVLCAGFRHGDDRVFFNRAEEFFQDGRLRQAAGEYWKIVEGFDESDFTSRSVFRLGEIYFRLKELEKAEKAFLLIRERYGDVEQKEKAWDYIEKIRKIRESERVTSREEAAVLLSRSLKMMEQNRHLEAMEVYERIEVEEWSREVMLLSLAAAFQAGKHEQVVDSAARFRNTHPGSAYLPLVKMMEEESRCYLEEVKVLEEERLLKRRTEKLHELILRCEYEKALVLIDDMIRRKPWDYCLILTKAVILNHLGKNKQAVQLLSSVSADEAEVKSILGYFMYKEQRLEQAQEFYRQALEAEKKWEYACSCQRALNLIREKLQ